MMQSPDIDPIETKEWIDSLQAILQHESRLHSLVYHRER